jgi:hypothetical protein
MKFIDRKLTVVASLLLASAPAAADMLMAPPGAGAITSPMLAPGAAAANLGFAPLAPANNLGDITSASAARANLGFPALLPGLSASVQGTGVPGLDGGYWSLYRNNSAAFDPNPTLTIKRLSRSGTASSTGPGGAYPFGTLFVYTETNPANIGFEWGVSAWMMNNANASTHAENVAVNGSAVKQAWPNAFNTTSLSGDGATATVTFSGGATIPVGHSVKVWGAAPSAYNGTFKVMASAPGSVSFATTATGAQTTSGNIGDISVSATWGGNFVCADQTGENDPVAPCIGAEFDIYTPAGTTDANRQRLGIQIEASGGHAGRGILFGTKGGATFDRAAEFGGAYQFGLDFAAGTFSGPVILAAPGQKIALDSDTNGNFTRSLGYDPTGGLQYRVPGGIAFSIGDGGTVNMNKLASNAGNDLLLTAATGSALKLGVNGVANIWTLDTTGFYPTNDNLRALGSASYRLSTVYAVNVGSSGAPVTTVNATTVNAASYQAAGTAGFTGTKTAGSCVFTIQSGIITNVTGC